MLLDVTNQIKSGALKNKDSNRFKSNLDIILNTTDTVILHFIIIFHHNFYQC